MQAAKHLIVVGGATASGKTERALQIARHFGTEILSCDSRQFYRELTIGTAKPGPDTLNAVPHHFIGNRSITEPYSAGEFEKDALRCLERIYRSHDVAVLAGGSGLYQKALCEGFDDFPKVPASIRTALREHYRKGGLEALQEELKAVDPAYYRQADIRNPARLQRALAVYRASGKPYSSYRKKELSARPFTAAYFWLSRPRDDLYQRINQRVDEMMELGLVEEARQLMPFREHVALQTVGYQELFEHFDGKISLEEAVDRIKRNTRRYAKRQLTWMRRDGHWTLIDPLDPDESMQYIQATLDHGLKFKHFAAGRDRPPDFPDRIPRDPNGAVTLAVLNDQPTGWVIQSGDKRTAWFLASRPATTQVMNPTYYKFLWQQALRYLDTSVAQGVSRKIHAAFSGSGKPFEPGHGFQNIAEPPESMKNWLERLGVELSRLTFFSNS